MTAPAAEFTTENEDDTTPPSDIGGSSLTHRRFTMCRRSTAKAPTRPWTSFRDVSTGPPQITTP